MKQVLQNLKTGDVEVAEVPAPMVRPGHLLIRSRASLISAGTERMLVEFGKGSLLAKARAQPEKVRQVLDKIKSEGILQTLDVVFSRLDEPLPLGYCNAGEVLEVGDGVNGFEAGDRVVNNGPHAEIVCVPRNLCAKIPSKVTDEEAAFTVLGSVGLQGVRLLEPTLGESIVVIGLGLIGLVTVQLLVANGCRVLGVDLNRERLKLAEQFGAETVDPGAGADPVAAATAFSNGNGVDGVLITASSKSNDIVSQAARMCRKRGRIVLVGVVGLELSRSEFYKKELSFQVSCSYGPGRYDAAYEERGQDYPLGFVRWTEQRNFEAILDLLAAGRLDVKPLINNRIEHARAGEAYRALTEDSSSLGIVLNYPQAAPDRKPTVWHTAPASGRPASGRVVAGVIGAGNFAKITLLPRLKGLPISWRTIADANGVAGTHVGRKFGFEKSTSDYKEILADPEINLVMVLTPHHLHARMVMEALAAGKSVSVEKPLCINIEDLRQVREAYERAGGRQLLVGFNRRFSPHGLKIKSLLSTRTQPVCMSMMVNAGVSSPGSWVQDPKVGGGRIIGEGCHWIDLMMFLTGAPVTRVTATRIGESPGVAIRDDKATITLSFADGSIGTLHYFGNGHSSYQKETLEVFCDGKVLRCDNFTVLRGYGWAGFSKMKLRRWDKGHRREFEALAGAIIRGGPPVLPFEQIENVMRATFAAVESAKTGQPVVMQ
ncbi:MAG TPA: bi-domain-containing oxidoreductase [Phycisphaerae bacterium]|nr:bi-domain-containing oxidoreductase [Phycisphaerae bacterium]